MLPYLSSFSHWNQYQFCDRKDLPTDFFIMARHIFISQRQNLCNFLIVISLASLIFAYHSYKILDRFQSNAVLEVKATYRKISLPLPVVILAHRSERDFKDNATIPKSFVNVSFTVRSVFSKPIKDKLNISFCTAICIILLKS